MEIKWIMIGACVFLSLFYTSLAYQGLNVEKTKQSCYDAQTYTDIDLKCGELK